MRNKVVALCLVAFCLLGGVLWLSSCNRGIPTPESAEHLREFHLTNFREPVDPLADGVALYVDYSTCIALGQHSPFFQEVSASLVDRATSYHAICGNDIMDVAIDNTDVYTLLRNIHEVNYAELRRASMMMAGGDTEAVLLTDGEYYQRSVAKGHANDPYLAPALKQWILRGHDVHILSEPYAEVGSNGAVFNKKRFYIIFTDDRLENNIYDRIRRTVDLTEYPDVDEFHISASHPSLYSEVGNASVPNEVLMSKATGYGTYEIQDWEGCDWRTIEDNIVCAVDEKSGDPLPNGASVMRLRVDRNSFGCYRITELGLDVYDINAAYAAFCDSIEAKVRPDRVLAENLPALENLMLIDKDEFDKHGYIDIHFNSDWFTPDALTGSPYNYMMLVVRIAGVTPIFANHERQFVFDDIAQPGMQNVSVASSIKQCLADDEVLARMCGQVIYTIYVKSEAK